MPLTKKGQTIKAAMTKEYGADKGERVFYASANKGTIGGVEKKKREPSTHQTIKKMAKARKARFA